MEQWFEGKVALVTGAGSGIGRASALGFARRGAAVVVSDIAEGTGKETVDIITGEGGRATFVHADTGREEDIVALVDSTILEYGRLDCAHNNAGIGLPAFVPFFDISSADWDRVVNVNYRGVFLCMKYQIPHLLKQSASAIVVTASRAAFFGGPGNSPYTSSKHAVVGLVKSVALEFASRGLRVNAICPSYTRTTMTLRHPQALLDQVSSSQPMGRPAEADEVAAAVQWLCSTEASFINGVALPVDGGSSVLPADLVQSMLRISGREAADGT
jgi:NAD(P)-dependent dehydrogenase (short-subunit alcohol dehydrogenase family)